MAINKKAMELASEIQCLYATKLPPLMEQAKLIIESLPPKQPHVTQLVFASFVDRQWVLLHDASESLTNNLGKGYFATAAIVRSMMENAILLLYFNQDKTGKAVNGG